MYKLLLCLRYLRTRYLAFVCIGSVMLGVATLIVVNSVMSGFSNKMRERVHGILADVVVNTHRSTGLSDSPEVMEKSIADSPVGPHVEAVSPSVEVFALLQFQVRDRAQRRVPVTRHVRLIGVDPERHARVCRFSEYLVRQNPSKHVGPITFEMTPGAKLRFDLNHQFFDDNFPPTAPGKPSTGDPFDLFPPTKLEKEKSDLLPAGGLEMPLENAQRLPPIPPPVIPKADPPRIPGVILGYSLAHYRYKDEAGVASEIAMLSEGDEVTLMTYGASGEKVAQGTFAVTDFFKSEMSDYDGSLVYVSLDELKRIRGMGEHVTDMQLKLKPESGADERLVHRTLVPQLQKIFPPTEARVQSWQQAQGPVLAAIDIERGLLNILLFLIVGVAGFSLLAIFTMIVTEKTRDIGIMKSLGASNRGVMSIFVGYGLLLGIVGSVLGTLLGLAITLKINELEAAIARVSGREVFDRSVYYFDKIPTNIEPLSVVIIDLVAIFTAVMFSVLPAFRAARLHPIRALRFE